VNLAGASIRDANLSGVPIDGVNIDGLRIDGVPVSEALEHFRRTGSGD